MSALTANLIQIDTNDANAPLRYWTGQGTLSFQVTGDTALRNWIGSGSLIRVSNLEIGEPDRRLSIQLSAVPANRRSHFLQDYGPKRVQLWWIFSLNRGQNWNEAPLKFMGKLSSPQMHDGSLQVEIETLRGDVDHGTTKMWSHEDQQRSFSGDKGFEHMRALSQQGVDTTWPP